MSTATKEQKNQVEPTAPIEPMPVMTIEPGVALDYAFTKTATLSERVRRYVLEKSGSLTEIARITSLPKTTLNPWLLGQKGITTTVLDKICEAYAIYPVRLFGENSDNVPSACDFSPMLQEVSRASIVSETEAMRKLSEEHKREREKLNELVDWYQSRIDQNGVMLTQLMQRAEELGKIVERLTKDMEAGKEQ